MPVTGFVRSESRLWNSTGTPRASPTARPRIPETAALEIEVAITCPSRNLDACCLHFFDGTLAVARMNIDAANAGCEQDRAKAEVDGVERRGFHAVVGGQAGDVNCINAM